MKAFFQKYLLWLKSPYAWAPIALFLYLLFADRYNIIRLIQLETENRSLLKEISSSQKNIKINQQKYYELQSDSTLLEKYARENLLMKKPNEDIFIIEE